MSQFSIRQAVGFAGSAYVKHWMVLLAAGLVVGVSHYVREYVPRMVAQKLEIYQQVTVKLDMAEQPVMQQAHFVLEKISAHLQNTPKHLLLIMLLTLLVCWVLYAFVLCGFIRIVLNIKDKDTAHLGLFLEDTKVIFRAMGTFLIILLYALSMLVGIAFLSVPAVMIIKHLLGVGLMRIMMGMTSMIVIAGAFGYWLVSYLFPLFCLVDKPQTTIRAALAMGQTLVSGMRIKLLGALFLLACIIMPISAVIINFLGVFGVASVHQSLLQQSIASVITAPFGYLYMGFIYRALTEK